MWTKVNAWQQTGNVGKCAVRVTPKGAQVRGARSPERISIVALRLSMWVLSVELEWFCSLFWCLEFWDENFRTRFVGINCRVEQVRRDLVNMYVYHPVEQVNMYIYHPVEQVNVYISHPVEQVNMYIYHPVEQVNMYIYHPVEQMTRSAHVDTASEPLKSTVRYFTGEGSQEL